MTTKKPTFEEQMIALYGADKPRPATPEEYELAHAYRAKARKEFDDKIDAMLRKQDEEQGWQRFLAQKPRKVTVYKPLNAVTLDSIGGEELERRLAAEKGKKQEEKVKQQQRTADLQRQQQNSYAQAAQTQERVAITSSPACGTTRYDYQSDRMQVWDGYRWVPQY
jgi:uncharacterized membrane protein YqiK